MAANDNPYLALLQQEDKPPSLAQILQHVANLGFGMAGGLGQAASQGGSTIGGLGTGLILGNQINAQQAQRAEQERMKRLEWQFRAQEHEDKRAEMIRKQKALEAFGSGFNVTPQQGPIMGPTPTPAPQGGDYDTRTAALEGGTKKGGMVFNELGSGAFGPYQFMPATWAAVRAQNPNLNLPADITTATREQHDAAHGAFKAGNAQGLQAAGFQPTPENLYLAHRFGLGGALSVLRADENKPLAEVLPIDWQRQNPDMRGQTAGGFRRLATERMGGSSVPYVVRPDAKPTQYSLMPDDVPFSLSSGDTTLPRPTTAEPTMTAPVMPQPTWEKPGDVVPVNPASWFPQQQPTAPPAVPVPGGPPPAPGTPTGPGGPNVVQAQYQPQPGGPTMAPGGGPAPGAVDAPPQRPVTPMPQPDPEVVARAKAGYLAGALTADQAVGMVRQNVMDKYKQAEAAVDAQHATALEVFKQRQESRRHERGEEARLKAEERAETRRLEAAERAEKLRLEAEARAEERRVEAEQRRQAAAAAAPPPGYRKRDDGVLEPVPGGPADPDRQAPAGYRRKADGTLEFVPGGPADPSVAKRSSPMNNEQARDAGFADRMQTSNQLLATFDVQGTKDWQRLFEKVPFGAYAQSPEYQQFKQARDDFINAQLRRELGAAIGPAEYEKADRQYFPQPGDKPEVIKQKALNRQLALEGMIRGAGPSYQPSQSVPAPAQSMQPKTGDPLEGRTATGPNGQKVIRRNGQWVPQ